MKKSTKTLIALAGIGAVGAHVSLETIARLSFNDLFIVDERYLQTDLFTILPTEDLQQKYLSQIDEQVDWYKDVPKENIKIKSYDGLNLDAALLKANDDHRYIILAHGFNTDRYILLKQAYEFFHRGFNVLLIDQRAYGKSEGKYTTFGFKEHLDLIQWIDYLVKADDEAKIGLYGVSMGAATVMMALGTKLDKHVVFAIEDSGYSDLKELFKVRIEKKFGIISPLAVAYLNRYVKATLGFDLSEVSPYKALENNDIPICIVHAKGDDVVPYSMAKELYHANHGKKVFYPLDTNVHAYACYEDDYFDNLETFYQRYI